MTGECWEDKCWAEVIAWSFDHVVESRMIENGTYDNGWEEWTVTE